MEVWDPALIMSVTVVIVLLPVMGMFMGVMISVLMVLVLAVIVRMRMIVMVDTLRRTPAPRILAEQQRFDRDRDRAGRHAYAPEIDIIEVSQHNSVDCQDFALDKALLAQNSAEGLRDITIKHDEDRLPALDGGGKTMADAFGESGHPIITRRASPTQRQGHLALAFDEIKSGEMRTDGLGQYRRIDHLAALISGLQDLQIAPWQQFARLGDVAGIAAELDAVLGCTERGRPNAFAGRQHRPRQRAALNAAMESAAEAAPHIPEVAILAPVDVFADAAGEHEAVDMAKLADRIGQIKVLDHLRHRTLRERHNQQVRHVLRDPLELRGREHVAAIPIKTGLPGMEFAGRVEPHETTDLVNDMEPATDVQRSRCDHVAFLDDGEFRGTATDVDVENAFVLVMRYFRGARAVGREHGFHVVSGGGGDEIAALLRDQSRDGLGILPSQGLPGEDDHAGVDVVRLDFRSRIGAVNDRAQRILVNALVARIRCERNRRLEQGLAGHDVVATGEVFPVAPQVDAGEDDLRSR